MTASSCSPMSTARITRRRKIIPIGGGNETKLVASTGTGKGDLPSTRSTARSCSCGRRSRQSRREPDDVVEEASGVVSIGPKNVRPARAAPSKDGTIVIYIRGVTDEVANLVAGPISSEPRRRSGVLNHCRWRMTTAGAGTSDPSRMVGRRALRALLSEHPTTTFALRPSTPRRRARRCSNAYRRDVGAIRRDPRGLGGERRRAEVIRAGRHRRRHAQRNGGVGKRASRSRATTHVAYR